MAMTLRSRVDGPPAPAPAPLNFPLRRVLEEHASVMLPYLNKSVDLDRVAAELYLAWRKQPKLAEVPPDLLIDSVCKALRTEGVIGDDVYLVPVKDKGVMQAVVMINYRFKAELVIAAGGAREIWGYTVYEKEPFKVTGGTDPRIEHTPLPVSDRGKPIAFYAIRI